MLQGMAIPFLDPGQPLLDRRFPLTLATPFTGAQAFAAGIRSDELTRLVRQGYLRRMVPGVYVASQTTDSLDLRVSALRLVVPTGAVVTDRTAGWLHGAERILGPGDHLETPALSVFDRKRGGRFRNDLTKSGQRMMPDRHVMEIDGLAVTTPLRTACDLGRILSRDWAFAALDSMLRLGLFGRDELCATVEEFKGFRWVRQLRALAPLADPRAESPGESVLRLRWIDCPDLPPPEPQVEVEGPLGSYRLDLGVPDLRFGAEYDGEEFHGEDRAEHDQARRSWVDDVLGWTLRVARRKNVFGAKADIDVMLRSGVSEARARLGRRTGIRDASR